MHVELCFKLQYGVFTENDKFVCTNNVKMRVYKREKLLRISWYLFQGVYLWEKAFSSHYKVIAALRT